MTTPDVTDLTGQRLDSRYQIFEQIGQGGMALVYRAIDIEDGAEVAIKILLPEFLEDRTSMARLRREAELGARLAHPNVCHIIRLGSADAGYDYIVMPCLKGDMLCDRTWTAGQLPLHTVAWIVRDVAAGLHVAHEQGIIHRDLKPENIMIVRNPDGSERAVVLDFGLALAPEMHQGRTKLTMVGKVVGTVDFMSPEQMRDKPVDRRSDVYSLAFMTYEMLTGKLPFDGTTLRELMVARMKCEFVPIRVNRPDLDIPVAIDKVLFKALSAEAHKRYRTTIEFGNAFWKAAGVGGPQNLIRRLFGKS